LQNRRIGLCPATNQLRLSFGGIPFSNRSTRIKAQEAARCRAFVRSP
jgi:hypothetical protein